MPLFLLVGLQVIHLLYHQITTLFDLFPFNGARHYSLKEKMIEAGVNLILMGLPPLGFYLQNAALMNFGVVYYFVLLAIEIATWWIPYFFKPSAEWTETYNRLHKDTLIVLPPRGTNPIPNLEHTILHLLTLLTAVLTAVYFFYK